MPENNFPKQLIEETDGEKPEEVFTSLYNRVMNMSVSEKVKLASIGNKESRGLLVKDSNKLVVQAVINNPRLTDNEAESFASNRNYSKEVPRLIASKKEFLKNYRVKFALVNNPKTPVAIALKLLNLLHEKDMRRVSKSRNVSTVIARTAVKMLNSRTRH